MANRKNQLAADASLVCHYLSGDLSHGCTVRNPAFQIAKCLGVKLVAGKISLAGNLALPNTLVWWSRAEGEGEMTIADVWTTIYPWIVAGLGGFVGAALLLPTKLGEAIFSYRLGKALEGFKAEQSRELERLKEQLTHIGDRGKRSNEMEISAIKLVWEKFVEAFLATNRCIAQLIEIPDFRAMTTEEEFETFLTATDFSESHKQQLRKAPDRQKTYGDIITWRSIVRAQNDNFDTRLLLRKHGIFMPPALKDEFTKALDILVGAQIEQQIDHQHRQSGIGWEKRSDFLKNGEAMFAALGAAANQRLFREELNEQRIRHDSGKPAGASLP